jgi:hypothetical protein
MGNSLEVQEVENGFVAMQRGGLAGNLCSPQMNVFKDFDEMALWMRNYFINQKINASPQVPYDAGIVRQASTVTGTLRNY